MRAVAAVLGTGAGSLYRYVASRDELVHLMTDHVLRELEPHPPVDGEWLGAMVLIGRRQLDLYRRHPWLLEAIQHTPSFGPATLAWLDHCLHVLEPFDCAGTAKFEAIALMTGVTTLFARSEQAPRGALPPFDPRPYPHLTAAMTHSGSPASPRPDLFGMTIRSLLTGLLVD
jgi:AcrR family transcriptional regulator